jgi:hypothetical protein
MGTREVAYRVLVEKTEGKRPLRKLKRRWENNIKMDFQEGGGGLTGLIWLEIGTGRGNEPSGSIKYGEFLD